MVKPMGIAIKGSNRSGTILGPKFPSERSLEVPKDSIERSSCVLFEKKRVLLIVLMKDIAIP